MVGQQKNNEHLYRDSPLVKKINELTETQQQLIVQCQKFETEYRYQYNLSYVLWNDLQRVRKERNVTRAIFGITMLLFVVAIMCIICIY